MQLTTLSYVETYAKATGAKHPTPPQPHTLRGSKRVAKSEQIPAPNRQLQPDERHQARYAPTGNTAQQTVHANKRVVIRLPVLLLMHCQLQREARPAITSPIPRFFRCCAEKAPLRRRGLPPTNCATRSRAVQRAHTPRLGIYPLTHTTHIHTQHLLTTKAGVGLALPEDRRTPGSCSCCQHCPINHTRYNKNTDPHAHRCAAHGQAMLAVSSPLRMTANLSASASQ